MVAETIPQLKSLPLSKKRVLVSELLAELYGEPVGDKELAGALDARVEHFRKTPASAKSWQSVKARLRQRR